MTVPSATSEAEYAGNGVTTAFSAPFAFLANSHLVVTLIVDATEVETVKTITTHYTVSGAGGTSGTVTMLTPPATGETLRIERVVPLTQTVDFRAAGTFSPSVHENALDRVVMIGQQLEREIAELDDVAEDLETAETNIASLDTRLDTAEGTLATAVTTNGTQTSAITALQAADTALDGRVDTLETTVNGTPFVDLLAEIAADPGGILAAIDLLGAPAITWTTSGGDTSLTLTGSHGVVFVDTTAAAATITFPTAVGCAGKRYAVKMMSLDITKTIIFGCTGGQTIDGSTTRTINNIGEVLCVVSNGANWVTLFAAVATEPIIPGGRLTLTTALPVTTADVTGATTVYFTPYIHNRIPIYKGAGQWTTRSFSEISLLTTDNTKSPAAVANNSNYDVFFWSLNGVIQLSRGFAWSSSTTRGTGAGTAELERVDGVWMNKYDITNGPASQRGHYVGTIRSNGSAQINDSAALRHVWNLNHRKPRFMRVTEATNSWDYDTATMRQANGSTANQLSMVRGLDEDAVRARVTAEVWIHGICSDGNLYTAIGLDSTTTMATGCLNGHQSGESGANPIGHLTLSAEWVGYPGLGLHVLTWLERGNGTDWTTWYGDNNVPTLAQSGIHGETLA